jgi:hypothetical protein
MIGAAWTAEQVRGMEDERGWGFRNFHGETLVLNFLDTGSVMNAMLKISLKSLPVNRDFSGSCRNIYNVIFLISNGCIYSSSFDSFYARCSFLCTFEPELGPTPASLPFFFSSSTGKM